MKTHLTTLVNQLGELLLSHQWMLATAESCTGGQIAEALTSVAGSSRWFERGFVTYSNLSKEEMLHVPRHVILQHGAVSEQTARAMAEGALKNSPAQISLSVTGIAGPSGGTPEKPVGTIWFAWSNKMTGKTFSALKLFKGDRLEIRDQAVEFTLAKTIDFIR